MDPVHLEDLQLSSESLVNFFGPVYEQILKFVILLAGPYTLGDAYLAHLLSFLSYLLEINKVKRNFSLSVK